jgi:GrpB-like predicted nucleotidyltransferase (UPF0157 family)
MIGLEPGIVKLSPYHEEWSHLFEVEKKQLQGAIGEYVLDIQHVGSTSIPGIPAKPIIDIGIAVSNFEEAAICIAPLEQLGYVYRGENGVPRRHYFRKGNPRTHHLHMNEVTSRDWENQILFRDYLRQHPEAAQEYAALKTRLARQYERDRERYLFEKALFIEEVLRLARLKRLDR